MINPFQVATQGLGPGCTVFDVAMQGFGFFVEVIVRPNAYSPWMGPPQDYLVTVRIRTKKGKVYEQSYVASEFQIKSMEKLVVVFKGMFHKVTSVAATLNNVIRSKINVFAKKK